MVRADPPCLRPLERRSRSFGVSAKTVITVLAPGRQGSLAETRRRRHRQHAGGVRDLLRGNRKVAQHHRMAPIENAAMSGFRSFLSACCEQQSITRLRNRSTATRAPGPMQHHRSLLNERRSREGRADAEHIAIVDRTGNTPTPSKRTSRLQRRAASRALSAGGRLDLIRISCPSTTRLQPPSSRLRSGYPEPLAMAKKASRRRCHSLVEGKVTGISNPWHDIAHLGGRPELKSAAGSAPAPSTKAEPR